MTTFRALATAALLACGMLAAGCTRTPAGQPAAQAKPASGRALADTAPGARLVPARLDSAALAPPPLAVTPPRGAPPLPEAAPGEAPAPSGDVDRLPADVQLHPPVLRGDAAPKVAWRGEGWIELDLHVDERGTVDDARWAAGVREPALLVAAIARARALRYTPARLAGRPVAVWCRQRFEAGR